MLPDFIEYLLKPTQLDGSKSVKLVQTHISYIILTDDFVYKIKKPVDFGFLNFTTLDKRLHFLKEELRLNKRLTSNVYLSIMAIIKKDDGFVLSVDLESQNIVDYALKMTRLKDDTILENLIAQDKATTPMIANLARHILTFHGLSSTDEKVGEFGKVENVRKNFEDSFDQTENHIGLTISRERFDRLREIQKKFFDASSELFKSRIEGGFVRECHGDMHSENISIEEVDGKLNINIFDCIEFNERFRYIDVVSDLAFLLMDLDYLNRRDLSIICESTYFELSGDKTGKSLLTIYKAYRAYVRGKVEGLTAIDGNVSDAKRLKARFKAIRYFDLCEDYLTTTQKPKCIITAGLSGSGKSYWAGRIKEQIFYEYYSSDVIRKELFNVPVGVENKNLSIYSEDASDKTYTELLAKALLNVMGGRSCILDATFTDEERLVKAISEIEKSGAEVKVFLFTATDDTVKKRMESRFKEGDFVSDAGFEVYLRQKEKFKDYSKVKYCAIDTEEDGNILMEKIIKEIFYGNR